MTALVLHGQVAAAVGRFLAKPAHALIIEGVPGSGKLTLARHIAEGILNIEGKLDSYGYFLQLSPNGGTIPIDAVRSLRSFLKLKTVGNGSIRRVVIIENAESMTAEAQNAVLKLLEEPPADTVILLTATNARLLLPTIASRTQRLAIKSPPKTAVATAFSSAPKDAVDRAYLISAGAMGLFTMLVENQQDHTLLQNIDRAKRLLAASRFERVAGIEQLGKDRGQLIELLYALKKIARAAMLQSAANGKNSETARWITMSRQLNAAEAALAANAVPKLVLSQLFLNI